MVMLTADHYILDTEQFRAALAAAGQVAGGGTIVTLGIRPTYPATGFGYVQLRRIVAIVDGFRVYRSAGFTEKPDLPTAQRFLEGGRLRLEQRHVRLAGRSPAGRVRPQLPDIYAALEKIGAALGNP